MVGCPDATWLDLPQGLCRCDNFLLIVGVTLVGDLAMAAPKTITWYDLIPYQIIVSKPENCKLPIKEMKINGKCKCGSYVGCKFFQQGVWSM